MIQNHTQRVNELREKEHIGDFGSLLKSKKGSTSSEVYNFFVFVRNLHDDFASRMFLLVAPGQQRPIFLLYLSSRQFLRNTLARHHIIRQDPSIRRLKPRRKQLKLRTRRSHVGYLRKE